MANLDRPFGFRAIRNEAGTAPKIRAFTAKAVEIFQGQMCQVDVSAGHVEPIGSTVASGDNWLLGAAQHYKDAADTVVYVSYDPEQQYEIQADDDGTALTELLVFCQNFDVINGDTGVAATGQSNTEIDQSSSSNTSTEGFKALGIAKEIGNVYGDNMVLIVKINAGKHAFTNATGS